jgi:hypothetical protein
MIATRVTVYFKLISPNNWGVFTNLRQISPTFYGTQETALNNARIWVSTWGWDLEIENE